MSATPRPKPVVLLILDGWGHRDDPTDNALAQATLPNWDALEASEAHTLIHTEGRHVGLPDGQMGNSEVGHMNLGAGRIVYQDLTRIDAAIEDASFYANDELRAACAAAKSAGATLHLMGLLSPGGVHSHERHIFAMIDLARREGVARVAVHAFLDGRDMPPKSAAPSLQRLQDACAAAGNAHIASISGRYYAMDRDKRWDRQLRAWNAIVEADSEQRAATAQEGLDAAYARGETDEFVAPTVIGEAKPMVDGDAVVFMNFRADRARQLTAAFVDPNFDGYAARRPKLSRFVCLTEYDARLPAPVAFGPDDLHNTLGELLAAHRLTQLRIAETEKYAHVTFFFSGGREDPYEGESRILVPSPKVATYDLQPEMSCPEVTAKLAEAIRAQSVDVAICNIANPDMVGHTGDLQAAILAAQAVDKALGVIVAAVREVGGALLITADHGNLEMMRDPATGQPHTAHTVGPVPLIYLGPRKAGLRGGGALRDVAPTILDLLGIDQPAEMTGRSLLQP
ncbi:2,3-bisphosphoglycerate-independent phosphoglycerate mutase [Lysobacter sp. ISL-50]|uniref:2,3-bisphosphoglycerate-independent phosphoglycerate mutase n=1 Tax=unclassified Lysobacter TaxID=2635362 RepID=UPI001BE63A5C|nr:2,3-bisphosphoglycerate-independent phosphoglycerate mutase [Lysobacter sp. ISL-42]MBT2754056.1 2,3-bisphosphoglycerate-independent phosphoglycerate mutase [Lysobacter sp. ISL-50]MBT2779408.1 2,3-bisphosphoglycerate-independent phosphoglycerate mutase [Lysobacter sp. ISL-54]MBT2784671.1 2,3-bisphosphoglycerate-independent phosphoglycerate mutase [Lysobacter sp. ISL-52]